MSRWLVSIVVAAGVVALGAAALLASPDEVPDPSVPGTGERGDGPETDTDRDKSSPPPSGPSEPSAAPADAPLLVWTPGGLPDDTGARLGDIDGVTGHTVVAGDLVELAGAHHADGEPATELDGDWVIPLDALAVDASSYVDVVGPAAARLAELDEGEAALGATSAELRGLEAGATLTLDDGAELDVAAVVDDDVVGAAELVVTVETGERLGVTTDRFALVAHDGERDAMGEAVRAQLPADTPTRVRAPGETPYLRHADAVLPQSVVKDRFGEFAYRRREDGLLEQDPQWQREHLEGAEVPLLGEVRCHRRVLPDLVDALGALADRGLGDLVDPDGYRGCHYPRLTRSGDSISRHAWGIAVDVNVAANPAGDEGDQDPRLVEALAEHGFSWGGDWLIPDPHHFEHTDRD